MTTQEKAIKKTFDKRFAIPLHFDFFRHPVYPYGLKEEKVILCTGDTNATYKLSDISLEFDAIFDKPYTRTNWSIKKILVTINGIPHQLFAAELKAKVNLSRAEKIFLQ